MADMPEAQYVGQEDIQIQEFRGISDHRRISEGTWQDAENLTTDEIPTVTQRPQRTRIICRDANESITKPMTQGKPATAAVIGNKIYIGSEGGVITGAGNRLVIEGPLRQIVPIGRRLFTNNGYLTDEALTPDPITSGENPFRVRAQIMSVATAVYCDDADQPITVSRTQPDDPQDGDYWYDGSSKGLYKYSASKGDWVAVVTSYTKITPVVQTGHTVWDDLYLLQPGDAVQIDTGTLETSTTVKSTDAQTNEITLLGILDVPTGEGANFWVHIERRMPELDFICEHDNRIFGCRYGQNDDGELINEIYASALGDPTNWFLFEGTAADSWMTSIGAAGAWTGCAEVGEYVAFFKEDRIFLLSGTTPGNFRLTSFIDHGVQAGSEKSLVAMQGSLIYKSNHGVMRLTPYSYPQLISNDLGEDRWKNASAGTDGRRYYISMEDRDGTRDLYVYDTLLGTWMRETPTADPMIMVNHADRLLAIGGTPNDLADSVEYDEAAAIAAKPNRADYTTQDYITAYFAWAAKDTASRMLATMTMEAIREAESLDTLEEAREFVEDKIEAGYFLKLKTYYDEEMIYLRGAPDPEAMEGNLIAYNPVGDEWTALTPEFQDEGLFDWRGETGWLALGLAEEKRIRVIRIRVCAEPETRFRLHIRYAGQKTWTQIGAVNRGQAGTYRIAHTPARRNDAYKLLIEGSGPVTIYSITYEIENGGDRNVP